ncbi:MAG: hypothetical protein IKA72_02985 [Clostridia bacterium]|nr:hypothetical protein [Clostridia bacterium]
MSNRCVCCGAFIDSGVARCKYCGAAAPVTNRNESKEANVNHNAASNQGNVQNQDLGSLDAWVINSTIAAEAARSAAEAARIAAEAARMAAEAAAGYPPATAGFSPAPSSVSGSGKDANLNIFANPNWKELWEAKGRENRELGIILTNTQDLKNADVFMSALKSYVEYKSQNGVDYYLLDLNNQAIEAIDPTNVDDIVLCLLDQIYDVVVPHYLLLLGDWSVVPCAKWDNYGDVYDDDVPSDLVYTQLFVDSPWCGANWCFENITQVGRIPAKASNGFKEAIAYFEHVKNFKPYNGTKSFVCSALVWEPTSRVEFAHLKPNLITSPEYTTNSSTASTYNLNLLGKLSGEYNLIGTNLHGSDESHEWYGQRSQTERFCPEAFNKNVLPENNGYMLMTEACYGARPQHTESMVVHSLMNGCISFVGSSRIAYGFDDGNLCCADVIAQVFTYAVACGLTSGMAFLAALSVLSDHEMDDTEVKTLAEFALYGDPSVCLVDNPGAHSKQKRKGGAAVKRSAVKRDSARSITLMSCTETNSGRNSKNIVKLKDVSPVEQAQIKKMADRVSKTSDHYVIQKCATMKNVKPNIYKVVGKEEYRAVYAKKEGAIKTVIKIHLDGAGNMTKVYHSK